MSIVTLAAETRTDFGKGASRRLRRLDNKVPAIVYGGEKDPQAVNFLHNKVIKALENASIYSSVFDITIDGATEHVILKDLQRHPYKPIILHMDLQRVSKKDILIKQVPLNFLNETTAKGVKMGGFVNHTMIQVEVRCQAKDLPESIDVDLAELELNHIIHLADLTLPKGVELTANLQEAEHNLPVVSIQMPSMKAEDDTTDEAPANE
ncbi:MAG: 50S ribosomal protein L25/general stress protein Ctc [Legionellaceae bacterium]|nr:50S ribosomal protein L25/general stress protein Ctc [Legionellaceae bacterium]HAF87359.1 50S ribosomal protein L25 [Legionellales bacterium]HCA89473.1 50S ribosomal protein L25 [Legionellales bacterium]|tara:strand:+ start:4193 stop:4816 length:624 start_codon:yes stop_codon:yes gene_type:complete